MKAPTVVTPAEWEEARLRLLVKEKELTRARDALAAQRRRMPWVAVEKPYEFEGPARRVRGHRTFRRLLLLRLTTFAINLIASRRCGYSVG